MSNVRKTLQMTSLLFGTTILFCYIAWSLGYEGFIIVGDINIPDYLVDWIARILLCLNWSLQMCFVLNLYSWKILYLSGSITIASAIGSRFLPAIIFTGPLPTLILIVLIFYKKLGKWGFVRLFGSTVALLIYQWMIIKFSGLMFTVHQSVYQALRLSINSVILSLLFFSIGGVKYYGRRLESMVYPGQTGANGHGDGSSKADQKSSESIPLDKFEKWVMRSVVGIVQVIQWMFILWVCSLDNLFLDALVMTTSFICHGMIIMKRKHLKPVILCTLAATAMFYFAARFTISFTYSQFFPIVIGLILVYTLYRISYQFDVAARKKAEEDLKRIKNLEKQIAEAWSALDELS